MADGYNKPIPIPQPESDNYWEGAKAGELRLRHCDDCNQAYFYPRNICPDCGNNNTSWIVASGKAKIHTFAIVHRPPHPGFMDDIPYVPAIVELEEGPRMATQIVNVEADPSAISIDMPVKVVFESITDEISLPKFEPA
ncbi:MAG: Zn-ribbon domain-containing OB-fold protein [Chloroflexi bacterium]|jgi:uncharacterized protein|nr:Zn-ribbon domain-containing OB-fold protein [Chloroflexota bacterium]MBT4072940.1 Zn-ribbon domain-containing OB-fold protein [Chloroflexota bacterium]MBT4516107.1 Zn-ribbon domain-containing OB-fold protein [Chloroflexota bacterium]MBT5320361.1 Zn-ribbon domain-containing OB-fold protein [Chloroflexota bacterium]MBT6681965.1 Zn-ribbon domain-containing OB-fold protein [Chloroflexota bacterium]